ncbi:CCA tRNA nucleotidyltransferase [Propionibacteriaceae bacterium Y1685]|uniref:CCA tRNA nucleotidyltransferase n=1 Tax=Microlunatus sp. Y1700 TaxID=3418487 RepID=UPI003B7FF4CC
MNNAQANAVTEMLRITPVVDRLGALFTAAGHQLHLVGGPVRDALLGRLGNDLDFTTDARPEQIEPLLRRFVADGGAGSGVWDIGREFGTIGAKFIDPESSDGQAWVVEVTTYRSDAYDPGSRKPAVDFGDTLEGDLGRRDFTVNAMAISCADKSFTDPYGGLSDLAAARIATPGTAEQSFSDDPLRMMRAARFVGQLGFTPDDAVVQAMTSMADRIDIISAERVHDELVKLLLADTPRAGLDLLVRTGLAERVLPELPALQLERDEHHRHKDVYEHSLIVLEQAIDLERSRGHAPDLINRIAALLHDIGKPRTRRFEDGKVTFHHHDVVGAKLVSKRMKALKFSTEQTKAVAKLVELHLRFHGYGEGQWTDSAVRRYVRDAGDQLERLHILTRADCTTRNQRKATRLRRAYDDLERRIAELAAQEEMDAMRPDLDGQQIMQILRIDPGPVVGKAYKHLLELRIDNGPLGEERARAELLDWWAQQS